VSKGARVKGTAVPTVIIGPNADKIAHILVCDGCAICEAPDYFDFLPEGLRVGDVVGPRPTHPSKRAWNEARLD
jgi:hypothetical protein